MNKNTILAIILSIVVVIAGVAVQYFISPKGNYASGSVDTSKTSESPEVIGKAEAVVPELIIVSDEENQDIEEEEYTVKTNKFEVTFTNRGGDIISMKLLEHQDKTSGLSYVEMADSVTAEERAFSIFFGDEKGELIDVPMNVKVFNDYSIGFFRNFTVKNDDGTESHFAFGKKYDFKPDDYMFELTVSISGDGINGINIDNSAYTIVTSPGIGPEYSVRDTYEYRRFYSYINGKRKKTNLNQGKTETKTDIMSWQAVAGKYFTIISVPKSPFSRVTYSTMKNAYGEPQSKMYLTREAFSSENTTDVYRFYVGPKVEKILNTYNKSDDNPYGLNSIRIDEVIEGSRFWGWLETIIKWIMTFFWSFTGKNWGVAIILTTILVKILFFPLTKKSSESTLKMQTLQPAIQELQNKYKNNPEKLNQEMMTLYQKSGVNPMSGCLPLLIQLPILIAMFNLFNNHFDLRGAGFIPGWIDDLSVGDSVYTLAKPISIFGFYLSDIRILPVIYLISQLIFGKVTQGPTSSQTSGSVKFMMYGIPLIFFFILYNAPSGLLLYWTVSNLLQMVQQKIINSYVKNKKSTEVKKTEKKKK